MRRANAQRSKVRARVEHLFAEQEDRMGLFICTIGIASRKVKIDMTNLVYHFKQRSLHAARALSILSTVSVGAIQLFISHSEALANTASSPSPEFYETINQFPEINKLLSTAIVVNASDYGVVPNASDNTAALISMRNRLLAQAKDAFYEIRFSPGLYRYTNNQWLLGLSTGFKLVGYGAQFQNVVKGRVWGRDNQPLRLGQLFEYTHLDQFGCCLKIPAHYVKSASKGATSIRLANIADSNQYHPGDRVLLYGFDQQFYGYPVNARYFDHAVVASIDSASGTIELAMPIKHGYSEKWYDSPDSDGWAGVGKPRIINKDHKLNPTPMPHLVYIEGAEFLGNPNSNTGEQQFIVGEYVILKDVSFEKLWAPGISQLTLATNSHVGAGLHIEADKLINKFIFLDSSYLQSIGTGTGVDFVRIARASGLLPTALSPRIIQYEDDGFVIPEGSSRIPFREYYAAYPIDRLQFLGENTVTNLSSIKNIRVFAYDRLQIFNADALGPRVFYLNDNPTNKTRITELGIDYLVRTENGEVGKITDITFDSELKRFEIHYNGPNFSTSSLSYYTTRSIEDNGHTLFTEQASKDWVNWMFYEPNWRYPAVSIDQRNGYGHIVIPNEYIKWRRKNWRFSFEASIIKVVINVKQVYTGANAEAVLTFARKPSWMGASWQGNLPYGSINLKEAGRREITPWGINGVRPGDKFFPLGNVQGWSTQIELNPRNGGGGITGTDAEMPIGEIEIFADTSLENAPPVFAPVSELRGYPYRARIGQPITLAWTSRDASSCTGSGFSTNNAPKGLIIVYPLVTTTYRLSCKGPTGLTNDSVTIVVNRTPASAPQAAP